MKRGASICPFMCDPHFGHVYFLFGSEHLINSWTEGSLLVCDFGGSANSWDSCIEQTAAREFFEETCGMVAFDQAHLQGPFPLKRNKTIEEITAKLTLGHYWVKIQNSKYTTFVVNIPWDPQCVVRFQHCRTLLSALNHQQRKQPLRLDELESVAARCPLAIHATRSLFGVDAKDTLDGAQHALFGRVVRD
jgi:hypothetical protein